MQAEGRIHRVRGEGVLCRTEGCRKGHGAEQASRSPSNAASTAAASAAGSVPVRRSVGGSASGAGGGDDGKGCGAKQIAERRLFLKRGLEKIE